jgi:hypothetical protein
VLGVRNLEFEVSEGGVWVFGFGFGVWGFEFGVWGFGF